MNALVRVCVSDFVNVISYELTWVNFSTFTLGEFHQIYNFEAVGD